MIKNVARTFWLALGLILFGNANSLQAQKSQSSYDETWLKYNQYSSLDGFGSLGSYGWHFGFGSVQAPARQNTNRLETEVENNRNSAPDSIPRLFLSKGTPWPLTFGASISGMGQSAYRLFGTHAQWTLFEGFQRPAIGIRLAHQSSFDLPGIRQLKSDSLLLGMSFGFLRYFTFSLGVGQQRHRLTSKLDPQSQLNISEIRQIDESIFSISIKAQLYDSLASVAFEQLYSEPKTATSLAKISYML